MAPGTSRVRSVSSILRINLPSGRFLAIKKLKNAVLNPPKCKKPVGLGANLSLVMEIVRDPYRVMMNAELSEYERQRLENIKQNQEILKQLNIKGIIPDELKSKPAPVKAKAKPREKRPIEKVEPAIIEPRRMSSRLQRKAAGTEGLDEDFFKITEDFAPTTAPAPSKPKRIIGRIPFDPEKGASEGFLEITGFLSRELEFKDRKFSSENLSQIDIQNEHSVVKVMKERIYSLAVHPDPSKVIVAVGGKFGELAFLDATQSAHPLGLNERELPEPEDFRPGTFLFHPHTGSISNLRYNPVNSTQLFSTSYDNIVRCMDITKGCFDELYNFGEDTGDVITGFDFDAKANVLYFSDTDGIFCWADRREGGKSSELSELRLHEKKIGCVSASRDGRFLATASNDGSVGLWDLRKLTTVRGEAEALHTLTFRRSVTSAYFHPEDASKILSTCYDDHVRVHYNAHLPEAKHAEMSHNNQTGRWITNFKAVWDPKSSFAVVGNMNRGIDLIDSDIGQIVRNVTSEFLTAQPAVNAFHPNLDVVASGNASGKIAVWSYLD